MSRTFKNPLSVFIDLIIGDETDSRHVHLSWVNENTEFNKLNHGYPDYFTSLSQQRYVNKANVCTINLTYVPHFGEDPNKIEKAVNIFGGECYYQYGYSGEDSLRFRGRIYNYSVSCKEGQLSYTFNIVSESVAYQGRIIKNEKFLIKTEEFKRLIGNTFSESAEFFKTIIGFGLLENEDLLSLTPDDLWRVGTVKYDENKLTGGKSWSEDKRYAAPGDYALYNSGNMSRSVKCSTCILPGLEVVQNEVMSISESEDYSASLTSEAQSYYEFLSQCLVECGPVIENNKQGYKDSNDNFISLQDSLDYLLSICLSNSSINVSSQLTDIKVNLNRVVTVDEVFDSGKTVDSVANTYCWSEDSWGSGTESQPKVDTYKKFGELYAVGYGYLRYSVSNLISYLQKFFDRIIDRKTTDITWSSYAISHFYVNVPSYRKFLKDASDDAMYTSLPHGSDLANIETARENYYSDNTNSEALYKDFSTSTSYGKFWFDIYKASVKGLNYANFRTTETFTRGLYEEEALIGDYANRKKTMSMIVSQALASCSNILNENGQAFYRDKLQSYNIEDAINRVAQSLEYLAEYCSKDNYFYIAFYDEIILVLSQFLKLYQLYSENQDVSSLITLIEDSELQEENNYSLKYNYTSDEILSIMDELVSTYAGDSYRFDKEGSFNDFQNIRYGISVQGKPVFEGLRYIASHLSSESVRETKDSEGKSKLTYDILVLDENASRNNKGIVRLIRSASSDTEETENLIGVSYSFEWGTRDSDVISWNPSFQGAVSIAKSRSVSGNAQDIEDYANITSMITEVEGGSSVIQVVTPPIMARFQDSNGENFGLSERDSNTIYETLMKQQSWFNNVVNYPYKADITVMGIVDHSGALQIGQSFVEVRPYINNMPHHSGGIYRVLGIKDDVSASGFTTTLSLNKFDPLDDPSKYFRIITQDGELSLDEYYPGYETAIIEQRKKQEEEALAATSKVYQSPSEAVLTLTDLSVIAKSVVEGIVKGTMYMSTGSGAYVVYFGELDHFLSGFTKPFYSPIFVNKTFGLPLSYGSSFAGDSYGALNTDLQKSFIEMNNDMKRDHPDYNNIIILDNMGFRSYDSQNIYYNGVVNEYGSLIAEYYCAQAGHSEHQTGLAIDFGVEEVITSVEYTSEFVQEFKDNSSVQWVLDNCYKYGFIVRYPTSQAYFTGYYGKPWHLRYVGVTLSTYLHEKYPDKSLEEILNLKSDYQYKTTQYEDNKLPAAYYSSVRLVYFPASSNSEPSKPKKSLITQETK